MALISEQTMRRAAARSLARVLRRRYVLNQPAWVWCWCDRNGVEPADLRLFTRSVIGRARRAVPDWDLLCSGYAPATENDR
jgi:hypothetical protein